MSVQMRSQGRTRPNRLDAAGPWRRARLRTQRSDCDGPSCTQPGSLDRTAFDVYRWVNLPDLAALWPRLNLPAGLRAEWSGALHAIGLLESD